MADKKKSPIIRAIVVGSICLGLYGTWAVGDKLELYLGGLPIQGAKTPAPAPAEASKKAKSLAVLYPVYIESKQKSERLLHSPEEASRLIDTTFIRAQGEQAPLALSEVPVPKPVDLPDYFLLLDQVVQVDAVMQNGAVLNGRFYAIGERVLAFDYPSNTGGQLTAPVLSSVLAEGVVLKEGKGEKPRAITIGAPGHPK